MKPIVSCSKIGKDFVAERSQDSGDRCVISKLKGSGFYGDRHYLAILSTLLIDQSLKFIDIKVDSLTFQILAQIDLDE
jgi:hypothetical protein